MTGTEIILRDVVLLVYVGDKESSSARTDFAMILKIRFSVAVVGDFTIQPLVTRFVTAPSDNILSQQFKTIAFHFLHKVLEALDKVRPLDIQRPIRSFLSS